MRLVNQMMVLVSLFPVAASGGVTQADSPASIARSLRTGTLAEREAAVASVEASPMLLKDPSVIDLLKHEVDRVTNERRLFQKLQYMAQLNSAPTPPVATAGPSSEAHWRAIDRVKIGRASCRVKR